jgi:hypothetical protein
MSRVKELPHKPGELVTVFWPGGPHNFVLEFDHAEEFDLYGGEWTDWFLIHGTCTGDDGCPVNSKTGGRYHHMRNFYVHPVDGGYALVPYRERKEGKPA